MTPQLAGTDAWRLAMIDHCTCMGRLRSPSSAASLRWSIKTANAERVKCSARMTPTRNGGRNPRTPVEALCSPLEWGIERSLNGFGPSLRYIPPRHAPMQGEQLAEEHSHLKTAGYRVSFPCRVR